MAESPETSDYTLIHERQGSKLVPMKVPEVQARQELVPMADFRHKA